MGKSLDEIAQELKDSNKKVQLIYAFNGTGKTRLSRAFKELVAPKNQLEEETEKWKEKKRELLCILQDIITAIEQQDYVLMHDAITYGVMKYLHWFIKEPVEEIV